MNQSVLSPHALAHKEHRALLLQFILFELIGAHACWKRNEEVYSAQPRFFPYDWAAEPKALNKAEEHARLLKDSFSDHASAVDAWGLAFAELARGKDFSSCLQKAISSLEPLMHACREDENLTFFLLKHRRALDAAMQEGYVRQFLMKAHPCDLETLGEKMCDKYHQRGFFTQIAEFKLLMTELAHE